MVTEDTFNKIVLEFSINGEKHRILNPDPTTLLVDYLRSTEVGLTGTKHACGQGGCGSCTVTLTKYNPSTQAIESFSGNSCLRLLVACDGMEITTVEGLVNEEKEISPVQYSIAANNGSQCGYCTPGFVMNMHSLLLENGEQGMTKAEIEQAFDGNICRCTGFRPILYAMKTFASDWDEAKDSKYTPPCVIDPAEQPTAYVGTQQPCTTYLNENPETLFFRNEKVEYYRPVSLKDAHLLMEKKGKGKVVKLVAGNTSHGIPGANPMAPAVMINIGAIEELRGTTIKPELISVGALTTYTEFLDLLEDQMDKRYKSTDKGLEALHYMAIRTAGKIVRNVATLAGNTMLVVRNVKNGYPFPSDLFVALACMDTRVTVSAASIKSEMSLLDFVDKYNSDEVFAATAILVAYHIPMTNRRDQIKTYKVAIRKENSHSLANAGFKITYDDAKVIQKANLILGGITTQPVRATQTEAYLVGKPLSTDTMNGAIAALGNDIEAIFSDRPQWYLDMPDEGVTDAYRKQLLESYLFKFFISAFEDTEVVPVPIEDKTAPRASFYREVSTGRQTYDIPDSGFAVNQPVIKLSAFEQATGKAIYTHDIPVPVRGVQGAFVTSKQANGTFEYQIPGNTGSETPSLEEVLEHVKGKYPGVLRYITSKDIPTGGDNGSSYSDSNFPDFKGYDDPVFSTGAITCYGQSIGFVVAKEELEAIHAAYYIATECIAYSTQPSELVLDLLTAAQEKVNDVYVNLFPGYTQADDDNQKITMPNSDLDWVIKSGPEGLNPGIVTGTTNLNSQDCLVVAGTQKTGAQIHFYMESQSCYTEPQEHNEMLVKSSSQSPTSIQSKTAGILNIGVNNIHVDIKRLGGGYGGKTTRTPYVASPTALASVLLDRPVRTAMPRNEDSYMVGSRHPFLGEYNIAIVSDGPDKGKILGTTLEYYSDGGNSKDCSFDVMDCANLGSDNCYNVPNFQTEGYVVFTNKRSNGAMRSYGGVQSSLVSEEAIEAAAHAIGMLPEDVREQNFYQAGDLTPYGQELDYCIIQDVWDRLKKTSDFKVRAAAVEKFNNENKWKKRGISMIPLKYGMGYNLGFLMQGGALVDVYSADATVLISHGGIEMGQGIMTKMAQVAAETLNIPINLIQMESTRTSTVPNPIGTGATSGSDLNGGAVKKACEIQRAKLEAMCLKLLKEKGQDHCVKLGINYWDYEDKDGWRTKVPIENPTNTIWYNVVKQAQVNRVDLSSQALYATPGLENLEDQQFYGFTYSACCSEVEIDVLTGESNILRSDIIYDIGESLNPAIDIGQIEGAFIMGVGYMLTEDVIFEPKETTNTPGQLNTPNTWTYKPPCAKTIPIDFRVDLFPRDSSEIPVNPNLMMNSKGVGEPPLVLANTVFFAVKHAIMAARKDRGHTDWFEMRAPAMVQDIREHCLVDASHLTV